MFDSLREELNKIALMESDELDALDTGDVIDDGAADDELVDDEDFDAEEMEDSLSLGEDYDFYDYDDYDDYMNEGADPETIEAIVESLIMLESDDYDDDDEDSMDYTDGVIGNGDDDELYDDDDEDDSSSADIDGVTNSIHEDIDDDDEEELDELLEEICGTSNDIFGDCSDMPEDDVPPSPQYQKMMARRASGREFVDYGNGNYKNYGKVLLDKELLNHMTVDDDAFDEEGNDYDLYASAGNIYDDDENEEFYGIRNQVSTDSLYGRHSINNINAAKLRDRYGDEEALDESVAAFLNNYMD